MVTLARLFIEHRHHFTNDNPKLYIKNENEIIPVQEYEIDKNGNFILIGGR